MSAPASEARVATSENNPSAAVWEWQFFRGPAKQGLFCLPSITTKKELPIDDWKEVVSPQFSVLSPRSEGPQRGFGLFRLRHGALKTEN
jgi:hypothetical protein